MPNPTYPTSEPRILYRIKEHTASSQIVEGTYLEGVTKAEVEKQVKGTFGGRFVYFERGMFKYIAYTD